MEKNKLIFNIHTQGASIFKSKEFRLNFLFEEETSTYLFKKKGAKIFFIQGIQGSGKTIFIENISKRYASDDNFLYIPLFDEITLDDIYIQLYYQIFNSNQAFILNKNINDPIDIRIINILKDKTIKKNIVLDNIGEVDPKILNFIKFLSEKAQNTSIIIAGRIANPEIEPLINKTLLIKPLNQEKVVSLLDFLEVDFSTKIISQLLDITDIYTSDIFKLNALIKENKIKLFDIVMQFSSASMSFDKFIENKTEINYTDYKETLGILSLFNFPILRENFIRIFGEELNEEIKKLIKLQIIRNDNGYISIDKEKKSIILETISEEEIYENVLVKLEKEASLGIKDRQMYISRGTINSLIEKYSEFLNKQPLKKIDSKLQKNRKTNKSDYAYLNTNIEITNDDIESLMLSDFEQDLLEDKDLQNKDFELVEHIETIKPRISIEKLIKRAFEYEKDKEYTHCIECLLEALNEAENKKDTEKIIFILNKLSNIYSRIGDFENCIKSLKHAFNIASLEEDKPKMALISFHMGKCYKKFFKYDEAKEAFINYINSPNINESFKTEATLNVAEIFYESKEFDKALKYYREIILSPTKIRNKTKALFYKALIHDEKDDIKEALTTYQKCIELSDDAFENKYLAPAYGNIANILYETQDNENAIAFYQKSLEIDIEIKNYEGKFFTYSKLGNILYEDKNFAEALIYFKKKLKTALRLDKTYHIAESYMDIGDTFLKLNDLLKAKKCYILAKKSVDDTISIESIEKIEKRLNYINEALKNE